MEGMKGVDAVAWLLLIILLAERLGLSAGLID